MPDPKFPDGGTRTETPKMYVACCPISAEMLWAAVYEMDYSPGNPDDHESVVLYSDNSTNVLATGWTLAYERALAGKASVANVGGASQGWFDAAYYVYGALDACFHSFASWCDGFSTTFAFVGNMSNDDATGARNFIYSHCWINNAVNTTTYLNSKRINEVDRDTAGPEYSCGQSAAISRVGVEERRYLFFLGHDGHYMSWYAPYPGGPYATIRPEDTNDQFSARLFICWSDSPDYLGKDINVIPLSTQYGVGPYQFQMSSRMIHGCVDDRGYYHAVAIVRTDVDKIYRILYIKPLTVNTWTESIIFEGSSSSDDITSPQVCFDRFSKTLVIAFGRFIQKRIGILTSNDYGNNFNGVNYIPIDMADTDPDGIPISVQPNIAMASAWGSGTMILTINNAIRVDEDPDTPTAVWYSVGTNRAMAWSEWAALTTTMRFRTVGDDYPWGGQINMAGGRNTSFAAALPGYVAPDYINSYARFYSTGGAPIPSNTYANANIIGWKHLYDTDLPPASGRNAGTVSQYGADLLITSTGRVLVAEQNAYHDIGSANDMSHYVHYSDDNGATWDTVDIWAYTPTATNGFGYSPAEPDSTFPFLARNGTDIYYVTNTKDDVSATTDRVCVQKSTDDGLTWSARNVYSATEFRVVAGAASATGLYMVAYYNPIAGEYMLCRSTNEGVSWTQTSTGVTGEGVNLDVPYRQSVAVDGNGWAHVVLSGVRISNGKFCCAYFRPTSASAWAAPVFIYESDYPLSVCRAAQVVVSGTNVYVFFSVGKEIVNQWMCHSTDSGVTMSAVRKVFSRATYFPYQHGNLAQVCVTADNKLHMLIAGSWRLDVKYNGAGYEGDYYISSVNNGVTWTGLQQVFNDGTYLNEIMYGPNSWEWFRLVPANSGTSFYFVGYSDYDGVMYARRA